VECSFGQHVLGGDHLFATDEPATGFARSEEQIIEVQIWAEVLRVSVLIRAIEVHECRIQSDGWHGEEFLAVLVRRRLR